MHDASAARPSWVSRLSSLTAESLFVFTALFAALLSLRGLAVITIFQERDLQRARQAARGEWFLYGPEVTGGGHLPGAFYYYLNAIPMKLGLDWEGCWQLTLMLGAAAFALMWWCYRRYLSLEAALAGAVALLCMPQFLKTLVYFQNFSILPVFIVTALVGLGLAFAFEPRRTRLGWILFCASMALGLQLHMSAAFLLAAGVTVQLIAPRLGLRRVPLADFLWGAFVFALILAPYYIWLTAYKNGVDIGRVPPRYVGMEFKTENFHRATTVSLDAAGLYQLRRLLRDARFTDEFSLLLSMPMIAIALWLLSVRSQLLPRAGAVLSQAEAALRVWSVGALFTLPPAIHVVIAPHRSRYFTCFCLTAVFAFTAWFETYRARLKNPLHPYVFLLCFPPVLVTAFVRFSRFQWQPLRAVPWGWVAAAPVAAAGFYFLWQRGMRRIAALGLIAFLAIFTYEARLFDTYKRDTGPRLAVLEAASAEIVARTGWPWEKLRERLFHINFQYQRSMSTIYRHAWEDAKGSVPKGPEPDGFILALNFKARQKNWESLKTYFSFKVLPPLITQGLASGEIELTEMIIMPDDAVLLPYVVRDKYKYPPHFQNVGINYLEFPSEEKPVRLGSEAEAERVAPGHTRFHFNSCPDRQPFCTIHYDIHEVESELVVRMTGDVLSQPSVWISPDWSQTVYGPYIEVECARAARPQRLMVADQIGVMVEMLKSRHINSVVLAPLVRRFKNPCPGRIQGFKAGYVRSTMTQSRQVVRPLPGKELSLSLRDAK